MNANFWRDRPVLITGSTGLLGGWMLQRLVESRADSVLLVRDWVPKSHAAASGNLGTSAVVRGDLTDQPLLERVMNEYEIDTVFHLAAQTLVPVANRNPLSTFEGNIKGTWTVLESARRCPTVRQIVVASSDKAYGEQPRLPYTETQPLEGRHPYDVSKSCADLLAQSYARTFGLPVVVSRCGNLFGGGDLNWNRIIPGTIRSVLRGKRPVIRSDGKFVRDYIYVEDAADALILLAENLAGRRTLAGEAFNFSEGRPMTVLAVANLILKVMESNLKPVVKNEAVNEIRKQYLDSRKARRVLGWKPAVGIEDGLRRTIAWYRENI